jgi:4-hydroxy-tetrahydrodipicolinate synthase
MRNPAEAKALLRGPIPGLPVLFTSDGKINHAGMCDHVQFLIENGLTVLLLSVGISEYLHLSEEEIRAVVQNVVRAADSRALVIAETGPWWTGQAVEFVHFAEEVGVDVVLILAPDPYYLPYEPALHDDALYAHFETVTTATCLGVLVHEKGLAARGTIRPWSIELIRRVATIDNVIGLKEESGNFAYSLDILATVGDRVAVIDDAGKTSFIYTYGHGSPAYITGIGQFAPQVSLSFWNALISNNLVEARRIAVDIALPIDCLGLRLGWVAFIKAAMDLYGLPGGPMRKPGISLTTSQKEEVRHLLDQLGLLPGIRS